MNELIKPREAAKMLAVSLSTLRKWIMDGNLTEIRTIGGHRRFKLSEIKNILEKYEQNKHTKRMA